MHVTFVGDPLARVHADILVMGFFEDVRPLRGLVGQFDWLAGGALSRLIIARRLTGRLHETALLALHTFTTPRVLCVGLGKSAAYSYLILRQVAESLPALLGGLQVSAAAVELLGAQSCKLDEAIAAGTFMKAWYEGARDPAIDLVFVLPKSTPPKQLEQRLRTMGVEPWSRA